ncbi:DUF998 domain-containing protein [Candidatus Nitrotoga sp. 1052]|uniref:DUF998 domain-containing protein n=1 Tax=Candidatus Nitrotoga sp. 1052 TaxID=2886964 RepID=UPI001EF5FCEF|nr:DUF998 domain-containing protein [Candidatus Nitrotoga sp. 1052]
MKTLCVTRLHAMAMNLLLEPAVRVNARSLSLWVVLLLLASAIAVLAATAAMPAAYSWRAHSISESAAQGLQHAWIARLAFVCFGSAVLTLSIRMRPVWARGTYWMHLVFAAAMLGTAAFSHRPWISGVPFDEFEDFLHSVTATGMGFAFCFGVVARFMQRSRSELLARSLDVFTVAVATAMPLISALYPSNGGLIQRAMFLIAYVWYGKEALDPRSAASRRQ